jgi:hypothetical protein
MHREDFTFTRYEILTAVWMKIHFDYDVMIPEDWVSSTSALPPLCTPRVEAAILFMQQTVIMVL